MKDKLYSHSIAPKKLLHGEGAWVKGRYLIKQIAKRPLLLGRSDSTQAIRSLIEEDLKIIQVNPKISNLEFDCCEVDLKRIKSFAISNKCDAIIASGGGKVLDAGKLLAHRIGIPCITIPLSASTCAGWTALSNIYTHLGAFEREQELNSCPDLLIFDHKFIRTAPKRTLASGIADALAKWYESSLSSGHSEDGLVQQAVQMSRVLRDQLLIDSKEAFTNKNSSAWIRVIEGCSLTAGLTGGIGGSKCRAAAAHAIHNGLTQLPFSSNHLHGELVGFGILVQLNLEEKLLNNKLAEQARNQLIKFLRDINLPTNINDLGLDNVSIGDIKKACRYSCSKVSDMKNLPFEVNEGELLEAMFRSQVEIPVDS